jgi:hypothetical protein
MTIIEPAQREKEAAIENILSKGLGKPQSLRALSHEIYHVFGFRFVFWGMAQALILSAITVAVISLSIPLLPAVFRHTVLFTCSPLLFVVVMFFSEIIERTDPLYELKMTCKYTIRQIMAFRIMCFSLLGTAFCVGITAYQSTNAYELLRLLPLSLCALFLCSLISLFLIRRLAGKLIFALSALLWLSVTLIPVLIFGMKWEQFLSGLPAIITIGSAIAFAILFLLELKKMMSAQQMEVESYAFG